MPRHSVALEPIPAICSEWQRCVLLPSKYNTQLLLIYHLTAAPRPFVFAPPPCADAGAPNHTQPTPPAFHQPSFHPNPANTPSPLSSQAGLHSALSPPLPSSLLQLVSTGSNGVATLRMTPPHVRNGRATRAAMPETDLRIPNIPVKLEDGMTTAPKSDSWREIVRHWNEGAPQHGLFTPLKDWPHKHYNGANRRFNQKYSQRKTIATEFLDE